MSLDHLRQFHTYVYNDAQAHAHILPSNSQVSVRRITAITEKHTDNENVLTRAQRIKQTNKQSSSSSMATAYSDSHARIQAHRRAHPKQPPKRGLHDSTPPTHKTTITGTQRPAISSIHTHTQSRGRIRSAAAAQITAHSQRDDGNDVGDHHGKGPAAIKLLFQLHPLDGRPINPNNHQRS